ncbi:unnamed protein product, partial [marine sediment metagenome]
HLRIPAIVMSGWREDGKEPAAWQSGQRRPREHLLTMVL